MALARGLVPGQAVTWTGGPPGPECPPVMPGERGVFVDYDGHEAGDGYVVKFSGGRIFCCDRSDVRPDPRPPVREARRHRSTG